MPQQSQSTSTITPHQLTPQAAINAVKHHLYAKGRVGESLSDFSTKNTQPTYSRRHGRHKLRVYMNQNCVATVTHDGQRNSTLHVVMNGNSKKMCSTIRLENWLKYLVLLTPISAVYTAKAFNDNSHLIRAHLDDVNPSEFNTLKHQKKMIQTAAVVQAFAIFCLIKQTGLFSRLIGFTKDDFVTSSHLAKENKAFKAPSNTQWPLTLIMLALLCVYPKRMGIEGAITGLKDIDNDFLSQLGDSVFLASMATLLVLIAPAIAREIVQKFCVCVRPSIHNHHITQRAFANKPSFRQEINYMFSNMGGQRPWRANVPVAGFVSADMESQDGVMLSAQQPTAPLLPGSAEDGASPPASIFSHASGASLNVQTGDQTHGGKPKHTDDGEGQDPEANYRVLGGGQ